VLFAAFVVIFPFSSLIAALPRQALRGEKILTKKGTKGNNMTRAKPWLENLTTLSKIEGRRAPRQ